MGKEFKRKLNFASEPLFPWLLSSPTKPTRGAAPSTGALHTSGKETFHLFQRKSSPSAAERENTTRKSSSQVFLPRNDCGCSLMVKQTLFAFFFLLAFFFCWLFFFNRSDLFLVTRGQCSRGSAVGQISGGLGHSGCQAGGEAQPVLVLLPQAWDPREGGGLQALLRTGAPHRGFGIVVMAGG